MAANPVSGTAPLTVAFTATASDTCDIGGSITKYEWDFDGNGTYETATTANTVSHIYNLSGSLTAKARVTDNGGATAVASVNITVTHPANNLPLGNLDNTSPGSINRGWF